MPENSGMLNVIAAKLQNSLQPRNLIKDACWFYMSWAKDPTVKVMLTMLDDIHLVFRDTQGCFEKLTRDIDSNPQ
ncbi:MAG: hypothetical protein PWQ06_2898 [Anaerophaga sp.]|nr:hypothetical protein [Anaerophaga sp.]